MKQSSPEAVGFSSTRLERIIPAMRRYIDEGKLAGILTAVYRHGRLAHLHCQGMADIEAGRRIAPDTIFRIFSMSKPITCTAVMMLFEEGHFQLWDPVSRFIPAFKDVKVYAGEVGDEMQLVDPVREITFRDLMTHTSGLAYGLSPDDRIEKLYAEEDILRRDEPLAEKMARLLQMPLANQPGARFRYSIAIDVLGYLVEVISGMPFDEFLQERIFDPLSMVDTGFFVPEDRAERLAALYCPAEGGGLQMLDCGGAQSGYVVRPAFLSGGGGLVSTAADYLRFAGMLLGGGALDGVRLLSRKTVELMASNHLPPELLPFGEEPNDPGYGHGLCGWVLMDEARSANLGSVGSFGWSGAASTHFWVDPKEDMVGLIMPQFIATNGVSYPLREQFKTLVYQALDD
ncbi:MAG: serine hydrolase domain-containing protein [Anaerolineae bacterium]